MRNKELPTFSAEGQTYREFYVTKYLPLEELQSTLIEVRHEPTGARVLHIANVDAENLFCLSFQTLPNSSNGVAHILEHTVLCGSRKYPVKDPFMAMSRRSLNTFMNAFTGQDFTCYPASSQVEKDFYNLLEVYLDAVFHPELKKLSFLQEGHRLEFTNPKNPKTPLLFQGVVYNEMKGSLASSESRLWRCALKHLIPDLPYAFNMGGDPKEIPSLTHEELLEFHRTFYHPSRCLFFFYGNIPLQKHLDFLLEKELRFAHKIPAADPLPLQKRFTAPVMVEDRYPAPVSKSLEKQAIIAFAYLTTPITQQMELLALTLLDSLLMDHDASPLRLALLQSGLCTQTSSCLDTEISEASWLFMCRGCHEESAGVLKNIFDDTLRRLVATSLQKEQIEASLHQLEFERTEMNGDEGPFGLSLFMRSGLIAQHGVAPENGLLIHTLFRALREKLENPDYLPHLIERYLLNNTHCVQVTLRADANLEKEEVLEERRVLDAICSQLSKEEEKAIVKQSQELAAYQEKMEHQSLDCLPKVSLQDVPFQVQQFALGENRYQRLDVLHHACFTNQILYADLLFDIPKIAQKDLPLLGVLSRFVTELGCGMRDYAQTLVFAQTYTGGVSGHLSLHVAQGDADLCKPTFSLKGKALQRNCDKLLTLFADVVGSADFSDERRMKELLLQHGTGLQSGLSKNALHYAMQLALSPFSSASLIFEKWHGLSYYQAVLRWMKKPETMSADLRRLQQAVLGVGDPTLVLGCDKTQYASLWKNDVRWFSERILMRNDVEPWDNDYTLPEAVSQVRFIPAPVACTVLGMRTVSYRDRFSPVLLLVAELLQNVILHKEIREKGGAYGARAAYVPTTGNFYLYSYRDPHFERTVTVFHEAIHSIAQGQFTEKDLEEAKLCVLQELDAPVIPGNRAMVAYAWKRAGRTLEMREKFRQQMISAQSDEIIRAVKEKIVPQKKVVVAFLGKNLFDKEAVEFKKSFTVLPIEDVSV